MFIKYLCVLAMTIFFALAAAGQTKLLRFPDIHADRVVFSYGGDLWTAAAGGGMATRLTAHPGVETFPKYSPDGRWIAFTGQYDGDEQVYVIPAGGGEPKQLTFYPSRGPLAPRWGYDNQVYGWTRDGRIFFRSLRDSWSLPIARLYTVSPEGGPVEPMPMPEAGSGDISPDGRRMAYSPRSRDFRPEKRYSGGQANTLYIYDLATNDARLISDNPRANRDAMWIGNTIYYNSDKDGKFNLYAYDTGNGRTSQVTRNRDWDIRWPSSDNQGKIIWERDGELEVFDVSSRRSNKVNILVPNDGVNRRRRQASVANQISSYSLSPKGERALFAARGDIFTAPIEKGSVRNLTNSSNAHDKLPAWSPDGKTIAFISDKSGEEEIWTVPQDGSAEPQQLTSGSSAQKYAPFWSADGKKLVYSDKDARLTVANVETKQVQQIAAARNGLIFNYAWSPKGNFVAFTMQTANGLNSVHIWSSSENRTYRVTPEMFGAGNAAWDPNGDHLFFISAREFAPQISQSEFNYATNRMGYIYALALRKDVKHPFPFESDEVTLTPERPQPAPSPAASPSPAATPAPERIDFDGIESRAVRVPLPADNYNGLSSNKGHLIYVVAPPFYYGRQAESQPSLRIYSMKDRRETTLLQPAFGYALSTDGTKLLSTSAGGSFNLLDATPTGDRTRKTVSTAGLVKEIDPVEEWRQIFDEAWRRYRDWFYVENMHGFDWARIR